MPANWESSRSPNIAAEGGRGYWEGSQDIAPSAVRSALLSSAGPVFISAAPSAAHFNKSLRLLGQRGRRRDNAQGSTLKEMRKKLFGLYCRSWPRKLSCIKEYYDLKRLHSNELYVLQRRSLTAFPLSQIVSSTFYCSALAAARSTIRKFMIINILQALNVCLVFVVLCRL